MNTVKHISENAYRGFNQRINDAFKVVPNCYCNGVGIVLSMLDLYLAGKDVRLNERTMEVKLVYTLLFSEIEKAVQRSMRARENAARRREKKLAEKEAIERAKRELAEKEAAEKAKKEAQESAKKEAAEKETAEKAMKEAADKVEKEVDTELVKDGIMSKSVENKTALKAEFIPSAQNNERSTYYHGVTSLHAGGFTPRR